MVAADDHGEEQPENRQAERERQERGHQRCPWINRKSKISSPRITSIENRKSKIISVGFFRWETNREDTKRPSFFLFLERLEAIEQLGGFSRMRIEVDDLAKQGFGFVELTAIQGSLGSGQVRPRLAARDPR